jgi:carbon storage regulator
MLVLTRRQGERIIIGEGAERIEIMVTRIDGDKVRIGIEAPRHVPIRREEVLLKKREGI